METNNNESSEYNNSYRNSYQNFYQQGAANNSGRSDSNTSGTFTNQASTQGPDVKTPKARKAKGGVGKKIMTAMAIGLGFGLFAGAGFQAVKLASDFVKNSVHIEKSVVITDSSKNNFEDDTPESFVENFFSKNKDEESTDEEKDKGTHVNEGKKVSTTSEIADNTQLTEATPITTVTDVTQVVKNAMPSVVAVNKRSTSQVMTYFGQRYQQESKSAGSGIIVAQNDTELLLVSNHHVVDDADELTVTFADDSQAKAQIKGTDEGRDLAVIAVLLDDISSDTIKQIAIAELGDSDSLTVGEPVIAIGNSLGYGQSVTTGVVSALNRKLGMVAQNGYQQYNTSSSDEEDAGFIQTDAAINPGNSGGALLDMYGRVIGINSSKTGGSMVEGMGYAIPISDAKPIIEELMNKETKLKVSDSNRGYLGITGVNVEKSYSEVYGMPVGVYVSSVTEGTGADDAGLVRGDIIVAMDGEKIESMDDLKSNLEYYSAGDTVELTVMQASPEGYQAINVKVVLTSQ